MPFEIFLLKVFKSAALEIMTINIRCHRIKIIKQQLSCYLPIAFKSIGISGVSSVSIIIFHIGLTSSCKENGLSIDKRLAMNQYVITTGKEWICSKT